MQADQTALSSRLMQMMRPDAAGALARQTIGWLRPPAVNDGVSLGRLGALDVRLAQTKGDVKRAQKLRYKVFYKNGHATADAATLLARRDKDAFDKICDHLMVIDHAAKPSLSGKQPVVGTYRWFFVGGRAQTSSTRRCV